jgi:large subunit ribosomal protein L28
MSKRCVVCGKEAGPGHKVSHSNIKTNRRWEANLQHIRVVLDGKHTRAYVCTRCLRSGRVQRVV